MAVTVVVFLILMRLAVPLPLVMEEAEAVVLQMITGRLAVMVETVIRE